MTKYKLYLSGLYYGNIEFRQGKAYHEKFNTNTGIKEEKKLITESEAYYYKTIFNFDPVILALKIKGIEQTIKMANTKIIKLETGETFEMWEKDNPYCQEMWVQRNIKYPWDLTVKNGEIIAITVPSRERVTVLVMEGKEESTILKLWKNYLPSEKLFSVSEMRIEMVAMRDGINLSTGVILPQNINKPTSVILIRTPYGKEMLKEIYYSYVRRGYGVVIQDVRGRNESEGNWEPMLNESDDGDDTLSWIGRQSWCNGRIGMLGGSYLGYVQWAAASTGNPYLKALVSVVAAGSPFVDLPRRGGTFSSGTLAWAFALSQKVFKPELMVRDDWDEVMNIRPLTDICIKGLGHSVPFIDTWIENYDDCEMWQKMDWSRGKGKIIAPALIISGWYDDNEMGTTQALDATKDFEKGKRKVLLGPWVHSGNASRDIHGVPLGNNALRYDVDLIILEWFDKQLKGIENGIEETEPVEYYTVGSEKWKTAENWPIPNLIREELYLAEKGTLFNMCQANACYDSYFYDPDNQTPYLVNVSENEFGVPGNYKEVDLRQDVLTYETSEFQKARTITGDMIVDFYGSSDAPDTDWIVKVEDIDQQGNAIKMVDGMLSARYRNGFEKSEFMALGQVYNFKIRTGKISGTIFKGHKLRLTITSSAKGLCFANSNTEQGYNSIGKRIANNKIYYGCQYPSKLVVPFENNK